MFTPSFLFCSLSHLPAKCCFLHFDLLFYEVEALPWLHQFALEYPAVSSMLSDFFFGRLMLSDCYTGQYEMYYLVKTFSVVLQGPQYT